MGDYLPARKTPGPNKDVTLSLFEQKHTHRPTQEVVHWLEGEGQDLVHIPFEDSEALMTGNLSCGLAGRAVGRHNCCRRGL